MFYFTSDTFSSHFLSEHKKGTCVQKSFCTTPFHITSTNNMFLNMFEYHRPSPKYFHNLSIGNFFKNVRIKDKTCWKKNIQGRFK